jgi:molecular chaperone GrpE (heat shock protein)
MLEIKQLTRLQIIKYCEKLEKENKKLKADTEHTIKFNNKIIGKLKLENDKLKVIIKNNDLEQKADWKHIEELEEANKKLHEICDKYVPMALRLEDENKRLNEDFGRYKKKVSEDMKEIVKEQTENIKLFDTIKGEYKKLLEENRELRKLRAEDFEIT